MLLFATGPLLFLCVLVVLPTMQPMHFRAGILAKWFGIIPFVASVWMSRNDRWSNFKCHFMSSCCAFESLSSDSISLCGVSTLQLLHAFDEQTIFCLAVLSLTNISGDHRFFMKFLKIPGKV